MDRSEEPVMTAAATAAKTARRTKLPPRTGTSSARRPSRLAPWLFALLFAALGGLVLSGGLPTDVPATPDLSLASACSAVDPASLPADESPRYVTQKIRDLQVGTWVLADNPELEDLEDEYGPIDPAQWRKIALRMEKPDGGTLDIDFLGPLGWLEAEEARLGGSVYLCMEELGIDGPAEVLSITSCPPLPDRPSDGHHLVTGKFAHSAGNVVDLHIEGLDEPIGTTANHPFWSQDRQEFVPAGSLQVGEHVLSLDGTQSPVTALRPRAGSEPVFNLEVETEHVYYVSETGILVHNECWSSARKAFWKNEAQENAAKYSADNLARMNAGKAPRITVQVRAKNGQVITKDVSLELHHRSLPQRTGASRANEAWNLVIATPWAHAAMDPYRHTGKGNELVKVLRGVNSWAE